MRERSRQAVLLGLVALLVSTVLGAVGGRAAAADGGSPAVVSPASSGRAYLGYSGPIVVEFSNAQTGNYDWAVQTVPGGDEVAAGSISWAGGDDSSQPILLPSALAPGDYSFAIDDHDLHSATVSFTVVGYAQPRCTLVVPTEIRVNAREEVVVGRLSSNCSAAHLTHASWDVRHASTNYNLLDFTGTTQDSWKHTDSDPLGTFVAMPTSATNAAGDTILSNAPTTTIRLASRVVLTSTRVRKYVTLRASLARYVPAARAFRPWKGRAVTLSYKTCKSCAWHRLAARTTTSKGKISVRVRAPKARYYRATVAGTSTVWAPYADQVRR